MLASLSERAPRIGASDRGIFRPRASACARTGIRRPLVRWAWAALAALAAAALLLATLAGTGGGASSLGHAHARAVARLGGGPGLAGLPAEAQGAISAALGADDARYAVARSGDGGFAAANPQQRLQARFERGATAVSSGGLDARLSLSRVGYGAALQEPRPPRASASANTLSLSRGPVTEWYRNGPLGLEQGFSVARPPTTVAPGALTLALSLDGNARAALAPDARSAVLSHGGAELRYASLVAHDARGRALKSWMVARPGELLLRVDAAAARYPVTIDPLLEQAKLVPEEGAGPNHFGRSVSLSADGNTALIGEPHFLGSVGLARVFTRSGTSWTEQARLEGENLGESSFFGRGVALSANGEVAIVGDPGANHFVGNAWVFTRSGSSWTRHGPLAGGEEVSHGNFGRSVALSEDGSTALVGGFGDDHNDGAAWVFTRSGESWAAQGGKLTPSDGAGRAEFGRNVALAGDGSTALLGGPLDEGGRGAAWVFTRSGAAWSQQGAKLTPGDEKGNGQFGSAVALSAPGSEALISAVRDSKRTGAAWIFDRSGSSWSQQGSKLVGSGGVGRSGFGSSAALSADGATALVGALGDAADVGAAWVFSDSGGAWTQVGGKLTASDETGSGQFGWAVALSADAGTALIGGIGDNEESGAAWVFATPAGGGSSQNPSGPPSSPPGGKTTTPQTTSGVSPFQAVLPPPVIGQSANIAQVSGTVLLLLPGSKQWLRLTGQMHIPFGTIVDARGGVVTVTVRGRHGELMTARYFEGEFRLTQQSNGVVVATLFGGSFAQCKHAAKKASRGPAASSARRRSVRKLWTNAHGTFTTKGTYAAGAVQGTEWLVQDYCEGTLVVVTRDKVKVTDLVHHRSKVVRAGHRLFVKSR
jgi:hypothetical protein